MLRLEIRKASWIAPVNMNCHSPKSEARILAKQDEVPTVKTGLPLQEHIPNGRDCIPSELDLKISTLSQFPASPSVRKAWVG